jgi:hypothetical protein
MPLDYTHLYAAVPLVPLEEMKTWLRHTGTAHDADITALSAAAQNKVLAYLANAADPTWTDLTAPLEVRHAIKVLTAHYDRHRGDDMSDASGTDEAAWQAIARLLSTHCDPTLA